LPFKRVYICILCALLKLSNCCVERSQTLFCGFVYSE